MPVTATANEMKVEKSKKVLALTRGVALVALVVTFFISSLTLLFVLNEQEKMTNRILECVVPSGHCYQDKIRASQVTDFVGISAVIEYCAVIDNSTPKAISACVEKELSR